MRLWSIPATGNPFQAYISTSFTLRSLRISNPVGLQNAVRCQVTERYHAASYTVVFVQPTCMLCQLFQILGVLVTYFLLLVQFANPPSACTSGTPNDVSTNYTTTVYEQSTAQTVAALTAYQSHKSLVVFYQISRLNSNGLAIIFTGSYK